MNPSRRQALQAGGLLLFTALAGRTVYVQVVDGPDLAVKAKAERTVADAFAKADKITANAEARARKAAERAAARKGRKLHKAD